MIRENNNNTRVVDVSKVLVVMKKWIWPFKWLYDLAWGKIEYWEGNRYSLEREMIE